MVLGGRIRGLGNERQVEQYASEKKRNEKKGMPRMGAEGQNKECSDENGGNVSEMLDYERDGRYIEGRGGGFAGISHH